MNTSALKTFAPAVRRQLMEAVTRKLDFVLHAQTPDYRSTFAPQVKALRMLAQTDRAGLIERVAYTWFNRLAALRFMDAKGWHPFRARVLTAASTEETQPELLKLTRTGALPEELRRHTDPARLNDLLDGRIPSPDAQGEVYRHLVLAACRFYNALLPSLFEKLDDETELLLPDDLLTEHSVVHDFRTEITDDDCAEVELLGWLYQFYISERKDQVMARKSAVPTEDIPAVTQLFTPHWIVRYLAENSLGRLWLLNRPGSKLREHMPYYIEGEPETDFLKIAKPEEIKLVDPASGSGHMLTYAFDLLCRIYEEEGYAPSDIPALILRHNLYGLEICARAAQLSQLALVFKAREKSRRFFQPEQMVQPKIIELRDVRFEKEELADYFKAIGGDPLPPSRDPASLIPDASSFEKLLYQFEEAKNFGSLIQPCLTEQEIQRARSEIVKRQSKIANGDLMVASTHHKVLRVLEQAEALTQRYHVVVANPPYMGLGGMNPSLKAFMANQWPCGKSDLFAGFIERSLTLCTPSGFIAMITMQSWLFLESFLLLRKKLLQASFVENLVQIGFNSFPTLNSKIAQAAAFTLLNRSPRGHKSIFLNLNDAPQSSDKNRVFCDKIAANKFTAVDTRLIQSIPGMPLSVTLTENITRAFSAGKLLSDDITLRVGLSTSDSERFLRRWFEVGLQPTGFEHRSVEEAAKSCHKWFPFNKGGLFRRWYGNHEHVINYKDNGAELKHWLVNNPNDPSTTSWARYIRSSDYYFSPAFTWSKVSSSNFCVRVSWGGFIFSDASNGGFPDIGSIPFYAGLLNSAVANRFLEVLSPTLNFKTGDVGRIPIVRLTAKAEFVAKVTALAQDSIEIARSDWDNFEASWDFRDHPLLRPGIKFQSLEKSWEQLSKVWNSNIARMRELETENNRLFITAYGLDDELQPEVPEDQITLARPDARKDMAAFLSYAVGCMMGRYSLDKPGLILANAGDSLREFLDKVGRPQDQLTFAPDEDGIIPVLDGEWFEDDIVARTREFLRVTFGDATLRENIRFIEESLGRELRTYFLADFYKDHLQTYKKRPIYWMVQSPQKGFQCLIYLHRYTKDTMNLVLNRYLRDYQAKLRNRLAHLTGAQAAATTAREKTEARKEADKLTKILHECAEWERQTMLPLAQARIELDLDDGVKTNYLKLGEALAPIAGLAAKEED
jgi:recombinational DNA repair protein RecR